MTKRGPDWSYSNKYLSFGAKIAKIGPVFAICFSTGIINYFLSGHGHGHMTSFNFEK